MSKTIIVRHKVSHRVLEFIEWVDIDHFTMHMNKSGTPYTIHRNACEASDDKGKTWQAVEALIERPKSFPSITYAKTKSKVL